MRVGRNIYPNINLEEIDKFLDPYGIKMSFLFDDGVEFECKNDSNITIKNYPGDIGFFKGNSTLPFLIFIISFGELLFLDGITEKELFKIPIYD